MVTKIRNIGMEYFELIFENSPIKDNIKQCLIEYETNAYKGFAIFQIFYNHFNLMKEF